MNIVIKLGNYFFFLKYCDEIIYKNFDNHYKKLKIGNFDNNIYR